MPWGCDSTLHPYTSPVLFVPENYLRGSSLGKEYLPVSWSQYQSLLANLNLVISQKDWLLLKIVYIYAHCILFAVYRTSVIICIGGNTNNVLLQAINSETVLTRNPFEGKTVPTGYLVSTSALLKTLEDWYHLRGPMETHKESRKMCFTQQW